MKLVKVSSIQSLGQGITSFVEELIDKVEAFLPWASLIPSATIPPWAREQQKEHENEVPKEVSHKEHHKKKSKV